MTLLVKTLYDVFPGIKAFGCCHEVFNAEDFLCCVIAEQLGVPRPDRHELTIDASGVNHFTWITEARYRGTDVLALLPPFIEKFYENGYCEKRGHAPDGWRDDPFCYGNKVKPIAANPLPGPVLSLVTPNALNIENLCAAIKARDLHQCFEAFLAQPLCTGLSYEAGEQLFREMALGTAKYLEPWYDLAILQ